jgi:hypothetical protein
MGDSGAVWVWSYGEILGPFGEIVGLFGSGGGGGGGNGIPRDSMVR